MGPQLPVSILDTDVSQSRAHLAMFWSRFHDVTSFAAVQAHNAASRASAVSWSARSTFYVSILFLLMHSVQMCLFAINLTTYVNRCRCFSGLSILSYQRRKAQKLSQAAFQDLQASVQRNFPCHAFQDNPDGVSKAWNT